MTFEITDCHVHLINSQINKYPLEENFEKYYGPGNYDSFPKKYSLDTYLNNTKPYVVTKVVNVEMISADSVNEARYMQATSEEQNFPMSILPQIDFLDINLQATLEIYQSLKNVKAVRQHLIFHPTDSDKRSIQHNVLHDELWIKNVGLLKNFNFNCELEVFSNQLEDLQQIIKTYPDIQFILPAIGLPLDTSPEGFIRWKNDMKKLSQYPNLVVKIFALECIFGMQWMQQDVKPWILETINLFGDKRVMFGSHSPLVSLSCSFSELYDYYFSVTDQFSEAEKQNLFSQVANKIYF